MKITTPAAAGLAFSVALSGCTASQSSIDAAALLEARCSVCHSTSIPKNARKSKSDWNETVDRMISKGAKLSADEKKSLVNYLAEHYRP